MHIFCSLVVTSFLVLFKVKLSYSLLTSDNNDISRWDVLDSTENLQNLILLDGLDLKNLDNKLQYFGLPQLNLSSTEVKLDDYRLLISQILRAVLYSKYIVPKVYESINDILGKPLLMISQLVDQYDIRNINCLIDKANAVIRSGLGLFSNSTLQRNKRSLENSNTNNTVLSNIKRLLKNTITATISFTEVQITSWINKISGSLRIWSNSQFLQDLINVLRNALNEVLDIIVKAISQLRSRIDSIFATEGFPSLEDVSNSFMKVDSVLHANEFSYEFPEHKSVKSYDSNQLPSNNPIEDTRAEASCIPTPGILMGIFDGHGGGACAQVVAKRVFKYITACLMSPDQLKEYLQSVEEAKTPMKLLNTYNDKVQFVEDVRDIYRNSFNLFVKDLIKDTNRSWTNVHEAMEKAVLRLDDDISKEALNTPSSGINMKTLSVAMSGSVAIIAHINGPHLNIAHVGDACAVLGTQTENNWTATKLTVEHNIENAEEVERILGEHPASETDTVLRMDRLLGQLAPLRSLGDFRYKWNKEIMKDVVVKILGEQSVPPNYHTPPYLTAKPEVNYHKLTPNDKFLVIASDGLWDVMSPTEVVNLVGKHMSGKVTLSPLFLPRRNMKLGEIEEVLQQRKESMKLKPKDKNAATHLIRNALGGTEFGIDHGKLSQMLSLPFEVSRVFRDDITVTVIYFDSDYLGHCPP